MQLNRPAGWYASDEAIEAAKNILSYQVADGGWSKNIDMAAKPRIPGGLYDADNLNRYPDLTDFDKAVDDHWHYIATLDNDATYTQIRFLARVTASLLAAHRAAEAAPFGAGVQRGVEYLIASQYPNGGWPQVWPLEGGYHDAITINDDAMLHAIEILSDAGAGVEDYSYLPVALRRQSADAARRGIACLLQLQVVVNGVRTVWAQQYDALTLEPTSARNYEMASLSSGESAPIVEFFMQVAQPTASEITAVHAAAAWFKKTEIFGFKFGGDRNSVEGRRLVALTGGGPIWSRYYQIGTDRPIFGDRDKTIHDDVNELSRERRNGYSWYNADGVDLLDQYRAWAKTHKD